MTMSDKRLRIFLSMLAAVAVMTLGNPARAGYYGEGFDPISVLGTVVFHVGADCESTNGLHTANVAGCTGVAMENNIGSFFSSVTLTDGIHTTTLNFNSNPGKLPDSVDMLDVAISGNLLVGIDTNPIGGFSAFDTVNFPGSWFVQFKITDIDLPFIENEVDLFKQICDGECFLSLVAVANTDIRFTPIPVPEPGSLGLILGALGAGWLARRRKPAA